MPPTSDWTIHQDQPRDVTAGTHSLFVHSRTAGTKLRTVHIEDLDAVCGWTAVVPAALRLPDTQPASHGKVVAPMTVANKGQVSPTGESLEFVWAPDSAVERGCAINPEPSQYRPQGSTCGRIEITFVCDVASEVTFAYEILAPSGNDGERTSFRTACRCVSLAVLWCLLKDYLCCRFVLHTVGRARFT